MAIEIRKAERSQSKLRLAIAGPSGAGKTMGALKLAHGLGGRVCMIDTERGSGDLYSHLFDYDIITLTAPFKPEKYIEAIRAAEAAGYDIIVVDSLSHAWNDEGGLLDQADKMESAGKNRFTMWADLTPQHRALVSALLNSPKHIVATVRSKQEYALERDDKTGKNTVRKMGMGIVQRDGLEYEFTVFLDVDQNHVAHASKDRTDLFRNEFFTLDEGVGERLMKWLSQGREAEANRLKAKIVSRLKYLGETKDHPMTAVKRLTGLDLMEPKNYEEIVTRLEVIAAERKDAAPGGPKQPQDESGAESDPPAAKEPEPAANEEKTGDPEATRYVPNTEIAYPDEEINPADIPF